MAQNSYKKGNLEKFKMEWESEKTSFEPQTTKWENSVQEEREISQEIRSAIVEVDRKIQEIIKTTQVDKKPNSSHYLPWIIGFLFASMISIFLLMKNKKKNIN